MFSICESYFWHDGVLYREMEPSERDDHDQRLWQQAEKACSDFLESPFVPGAQVSSTHSRYLQTQGDLKHCIVLSRTLHGFYQLLTTEAFCTNLYEEWDIVKRCDVDPLCFEIEESNGWGLELIGPCPLSVDELLTHECEEFRMMGKNLLEDKKLLTKIRKMNQRARVSYFKTRHSEPQLEYAKVCPVEQQFYEMGFSEGLREGRRTERNRAEWDRLNRGEYYGFA